MVFKDKSGREIQVGDIIAYGHALGRCAGMRYGKVLAVKMGQDLEHYDKKAAKLTVQGVDDDWAHNEPELLNKKSTLAFGTRILKLNRDQVSPKVLAILEKVEIGEQAAISDESSKGKKKATQEA